MINTIAGHALQSFRPMIPIVSPVKYGMTCNCVEYIYISTSSRARPTKVSCYQLSHVTQSDRNERATV